MGPYSAGKSLSIWMPKQYTVSEDFDLWIGRFESYYKVVKVANAVKCEFLLQPWMMTLSLLDEVLADYSQLKTAMKNHFASTTSPFESHFNLQQHQQRDEEAFNNFPEELSWLAIKVYTEFWLQKLDRRFYVTSC